MTPEEKLKEIDDKLDKAQGLALYLLEIRREHINRYDLNKKPENADGKVERAV